MWVTIVSATSDTTNNTSGQGLFFCCLILSNKWKHKCCLDPTIYFPSVLVCHCKFVPPNAASKPYPLLISLHHCNHHLLIVKLLTNFSNLVCLHHIPSPPKCSSFTLLPLHLLRESPSCDHHPWRHRETEIIFPSAPITHLPATFSPSDNETYISLYSLPWSLINSTSYMLWVRFKNI